MDDKVMFEKCLAQTTEVVKRVRGDQFVNPTPDTEWDVRKLVGHMLFELAWVPDVLLSKTINQVGATHSGDLVGETAANLHNNWQSAVTKGEAAAAAAHPQAVAHLSYGDVSVAEYLAECGTDLLIHAWDLAKAIGVPFTFDPEVAQPIYEHALAQEASMRASGLFGDAVAVPKDADLQTKLLALYGRHADWRA